MAKTHLTPPRGDDSRAEALLCFGGSGWDTREQGDGRGSSVSPGWVISPLEGQGSAGKGNRGAFHHGLIFSDLVS